MSKDLYILGAGGHSKVIIEIAEELGYKIISILDDNPTVENIFQYKVVHSSNNINISENVFLAVGNNINRKKIASRFTAPELNLIHPSAVVSKRTIFGYGNVVMAGVVINSSVKIGNHCIINTSASIDHDCEIDDFVHISPNVSLAGNVRVMEGAHVGIGATVKQDITIGKWSVVGAGAVVVNNVPDNAVVVGNPARILIKKK
ncbi:acetyltransferase [Epilithonimonas sp.]|uniref:acetyltransferase n=1 Tax=Epilithonimonas sp. TaxID=2894511 RepID=UPI0028A8630D|nr:acetyltransferase [Epilithonimonas sp.]